MDRTIVHQRIKYLIEEGGLHPGAKPLSRSLLCGGLVALIGLETLNLAVSVMLYLTH
jgi:hypothetical protein